MALVKDPNNIKLAMLGMVDGNGHPYSWTAIINGKYDAKIMADCGFPVIPEYLGAEPPENLGIPGVKVTHVWCDQREDAEKIARATFIPNVVDKPEDVINQVDAVIIPTDRGWEHVDRARVFIEAGIPIFIDKPLTDQEDQLQQFVKWQGEGKAILSTSAMRYGKSYMEMREKVTEVGDMRLITMTMCKTWERYGIHAMEGVYPFLKPGGWEWVANTGSEKANIVHVHHNSGVDVVIGSIADLYGAFGCMNIYGTKGKLSAAASDTFFCFKKQLVVFADYLKTGNLPFDFDETVELMKIIIAGIRSRDDSGRRVLLTEIKT